MNKVIKLNSLKLSCAQCSLSQLCLPHGLSHQEIEQLNEIVKHERTLKKGERLFEHGQAFKSLYAVRSGSIKITLSTNNGDEQIVGFHLPGEIFGFDAVGHDQHSCSAVALEPSKICEVPYTRLQKLAQRLPGLHDYLMALMSEKITDEYEMMLILGKKYAEERIAAFLLSLSNHYSKRGYSPHQFNLTMSRNDIGNYLGLAVETISRCISHMQNEKMIKVDRKYIQIVDIDRLRKFAGVTENTSELLEKEI